MSLDPFRAGPSNSPSPPHAQAHVHYQHPDHGAWYTEAQYTGVAMADSDSYHTATDDENSIVIECEKS